MYRVIAITHYREATNHRTSALENKHSTQCYSRSTTYCCGKHIDAVEFPTACVSGYQDASRRESIRSGTHNTICCASKHKHTTRNDFISDISTNQFRCTKVKNLYCPCGIRSEERRVGKECRS